MRSPSSRHEGTARLTPVKYLALLGLFLLYLPSAAGAQEPGTLYLSADSLGLERPLELHNVPWRFHAGDDPAWAGAAYDDSGWGLQKPDFNPDSLEAVGWTGIGWFRLHLRLDTSLADTPLVLEVHHVGASEVYFDGRLQYRFGTVGARAEEERRYHVNNDIPVALPLGGRGDHVLAVRYSFTEAAALRARYGRWYHPLGFSIRLFSSERFNAWKHPRSQALQLYTGISIGVLLLMGLLFLHVFLVAGRDRVHLYFSLFTASMALGLLYQFISNLTLYGTGVLSAVFIVVSLVFLLLAVYALYYPRLPRQFWGILGLFCLGLGLFFELRFAIITLLPGLEALRVMGVALVRRKTDAWIIGLGVLGLLAGIVGFLVSIYTSAAFLWPALGYVLTTLSIPLAMSVLLARRFARIKAQLEQELVHVQELSAQTLAQEREKQELIARQNERLEAQVAERTAELEQSLDHLKATQQQLVQQEKLASLGALTAGIAHEIKNPLNFVNNFAEVNQELADELDEALDTEGEKAVLKAIVADLRQNARVIHQHGRRADGIVKSMMAHARESKGEREAVPLNALIDEHVELAYHGKRAQAPGFNATMARDYDEAVGTVEVVPQDVGRVILNLVGNALDAVQARAVSENGAYVPTVTVSTRRVEGQVEIRVEDNGVGIPLEIRERVFEPFYTTKPAGSGTGLGLSLSYDIVTQGHGGTLTVESELGEGAALIVRLPVAAPRTTNP